jgi:hypothetical protein
MMLGNGCPPWAFALPLNSPDLGTSRWQLTIELYASLRQGDAVGIHAYMPP